MSSIVNGFECDIFIAIRITGVVGKFVNTLQEELAATHGRVVIALGKMDTA